jgi:hypothetical protein
VEVLVRTGQGGRALAIGAIVIGSVASVLFILVGILTAMAFGNVIGTCSDLGLVPTTSAECLHLLLIPP